jgi:hypothetical protein
LYEVVWWIRGSDPAVLNLDHEELITEVADVFCVGTSDIRAAKHWFRNSRKSLLILRGHPKPATEGHLKTGHL